ncbi:MFS transporter [Psychrobacter sanguinis]|uniref:MFS transporter n=2 Tax=Psychrobacter sanguinis TaxID=861445 RepID=UPI001919004A|nr:MFS transporter [Psychrobacter sanguinis]MCC3346509.1 MFS transporter [Psychrobacter sanguinis]
MSKKNSLPKSVYFLLVGQAINLTTAVLSVTVAPIVGANLTSKSGYATIPYGLQFFAILISTLFFSKLMNTYGRYRVFLGGVLSLFFSGALGFISISTSNFILLCVSQFLLGLFISTANFYRFAATDKLPTELVAKASTMVISGGVIAAIIAPMLAITLQQVNGFPDYSLIYLSLSLLAFILLIILICWQLTIRNGEFPPSVIIKNSNDSSDINKSINKSYIYIGILGGGVSYFLMNLMMICSSLYLKTNHSFHYASFAIQMHVLAMFLPSFFVSHLIKKLGSTTIVILGFVLIAISCLLPILFNNHIFVNIALVILGVGWNFSYSGSTALIGMLKGGNRNKVQGLNETSIALFATLGAFLPATLIDFIGWSNVNLFSLLLSLVLIISLYLLSRNNNYLEE